MSLIKILNKEIHELITAGEVVNRPAFVVKELVENSIDALSKSINVEIENGGKTLIRVVDDGTGMSFDDCKMAFLNHATSKIKTIDDLNSIKTLGFRGEALASICAVSNVEVFTKIKGSLKGTHYCNSAGVELIFEKVNCCEGTLINVKNLFYNVPERLKFLKTDLIEANLIQDIIEKLAISNSNISFSFKKNGKKIFQTSGSNNLADVIYSVFGRNFFKNLIKVSNCFANVEVQGYVSLPNFCKSYGNLNLSFVNRRYVKCKMFKNAVDEAFKGFITTGKSASFILFLKIKYDDLDINVHPNKTQIRFINEKNVFNSIYLAVKQAIEKSLFVFEETKSNEIPIILKSEQKNLNQNFKNSKNLNNKNTENQKIENDEITNKENDEITNKKINNFVECGFKSSVVPYFINSNSFVDNENVEQLCKNSFLEQNVEQIENEKNKLENVKNLKIQNKLFCDSELFQIKFIGELFKLYILVEYKNNFLIIDKHAAHERLLYEELKLKFNEFEKQILVKPITVVLNSNLDFNLVLNNVKIFNKFGFKVEHFGNHNLLIREVPAILKNADYLQIFYELVENLKLNKFNLTPKTIELILQKMACKAAIVANEDNSYEQLCLIVKKLYINNNYRNCPHGRPIILVFSKERLDGDFKRK